jgi:hypothetical protein
MTITYVNDLRLSEMATGDNSGTWGNVTNTNLELVGDALGYGTEAITTNADTHASTVADGSADAARAMYIKYTGTLDSACTITIGPNTISRVHIIENATSGSQNIIISQGSGANVTIPPGDTKAVYLDGAGSGAAVVDAFASLNVVDLKVQDDLLLTSDSAVLSIGADADLKITHDGTDGDFESAGTLTFDVATDIILDSDAGNWRFKDNGTSILEIGIISNGPSFYSSVQDADMYFRGNDADGGAFTALTLDMSDQGSATFNHDVKMGDLCYLLLGAGNDLELVSDGTNGEIACANGNLTLDVSGSVIIDTGGDLVTSTSGGTSNIRFGVDAGSALTSGSDNVAIGSNALDAEDAGSRSIAIGKDALGAYNTDGNTYNIAIGYSAASSLNGGTLNVIMGAFAGGALTTGEKHVAIGYSAFSSADVDDGAVAIGYEALRYNNTTDTQNHFNVAVGYQAGRGNSDIGNYAGGFYNTYVGSQAGYSTSKAALNVAIGLGALFSNTVGNSSTAVGYGALNAQDPAGDHTASNVDMFNTALGYEAGVAITTGIQNTIIGAKAGDATTDADFNVAVGYNALSVNVLGSKSTAVGHNALLFQRPYSGGADQALDMHNTAIGYGAGGQITTGQYNTIVGSDAGDALNTGSSNVAIGYNALSTESSGGNCVAVGSSALATQNVDGGANVMNTGVGAQSGFAVTSGIRNTFIGAYAGDATDDGAQCVAVGSEALSANCGNNNTAVGDTAGIAITGYSNTVIGQAAGDAIVGGNFNTCVGQDSGGAINSGTGNTTVGATGGNNVTTGDSNILIGYASVFSAVDMDAEFVIGAGVTGSGGSTVTIGSGAGKIYLNFTSTGTWSQTSDERLKDNIQPDTLGLSFINRLNPVTYKWKPSPEIDKSLPYYKETNERNTDVTMHGLVAQEVKTALDAESCATFAGWEEGIDGVQTISREQFVSPLIKAIQELSAKVTSLEAEVTKLKGA